MVDAYSIVGVALSVVALVVAVVLGLPGFLKWRQERHEREHPVDVKFDTSLKVDHPTVLQVDDRVTCEITILSNDRRPHRFREPLLSGYLHAGVSLDIEIEKVVDGMNPTKTACDEAGWILVDGYDRRAVRCVAIARHANNSLLVQFVLQDLEGPRHQSNPFPIVIRPRPSGDRLTAGVAAGGVALAPASLVAPPPPTSLV